MWIFFFTVFRLPLLTRNIPRHCCWRVFNRAADRRVLRLTVTVPCITGAYTARLRVGVAVCTMAAPDAAAISIPNEGGKTAVSVGMQASIELLP